MNNYYREAIRSAGDYLTRRSMAIVIRDRHGTSATGTAVCIQVGTHYLLATAGHVIEDMNDDRFQLIPASELSTSPVPFAARSCGPDRPAPSTDMAWLEVAPELVRSNNLRFLDLTDLRIGQPFDRGHPFFVYGYPLEAAILTATSSDVQSTAGFTMMAEPSALHRPCRQTEIALEYPPRDAHGRPISTAPSGHGFSGGGVWWHPRSDEAEVLSPEQFRLVALNTTWHEATAVMFATRIEHWLLEVRGAFPDTATTINAFVA